jgi:hypothetical protein
MCISSHSQCLHQENVSVSKQHNSITNFKGYSENCNSLLLSYLLSASAFLKICSQLSS